MQVGTSYMEDYQGFCVIAVKFQSSAPGSPWNWARCNRHVPWTTTFVQSRQLPFYIFCSFMLYSFEVYLLALQNYIYKIKILKVKRVFNRSSIIFRYIKYYIIRTSIEIAFLNILTMKNVFQSLSIVSSDRLYSGKNS